MLISCEPECGDRIIENEGSLFNNSVLGYYNDVTVVYIDSNKRQVELDTPGAGVKMVQNLESGKKIDRLFPYKLSLPLYLNGNISTFIVHYEDKPNDTLVFDGYNSRAINLGDECGYQIKIDSINLKKCTAKSFEYSKTNELLTIKLQY